MSMILFAILSFTSATSWIMVVHYIDKIAERIKHPIRKERRKNVYRIITAFSVTLCNHVLVLLSISRLPNKQNYKDFYFFNFSTFAKIFKVLLLNTVLFSGNWVCIVQNEGVLRFLKFNFSLNLQNAKKILVCPFLEEALFTVLAYHSYIVLNPNSDPGFNFYILNSLIFSLSHLHMKWNSITDVIHDEYLTSKEKMLKILKIGISLVLITFVYKLYCNWIFTKVLDFWSLFLLHMYCNMMGAPRADFVDWEGKYLKIFGVEIKKWIHFASIGIFLIMGNFVLF